MPARIAVDFTLPAASGFTFSLAAAHDPLIEFRTGIERGICAFDKRSALRREWRGIRANSHTHKAPEFV